MWEEEGVKLVDSASWWGEEVEARSISDKIH